MSNDDPELQAGSLPALSVLADPAPGSDAAARAARAPHVVAGSAPTPAFPLVADGADHLATPEAERYERRQLLGKGGMGRVTVARDRRLDRDVALKEVSTHNEAARAALEARLAREATVTARLEHPGIVAVYDAGRGPDGTPFYTMRVVRGRSLHDALRAADDGSARRSGGGANANATTRTRFVRHVFDAANAVAWAHRHGVVHRDLKPANIMVGEFGETQVVDWGLAHVVGEPMTSAAVGTPAYMSPEQAAGQGADARSDVWSLGAVLRDVVPAGADGPPELHAIIRRALASRPADRYVDAKAFADDLGAWLDGRRVGAYAYSTWEIFARLARAWRVPLTIAAVALLAIAVAIAIAFSETADERDRAEAAEATTRAALARADQDLAKALLGAARERAGVGARPEMELLAAASLAKSESPEARGILALAAGETAPRRVAAQPIPSCSQLVPSRDATHALCVEPGALSLWDVGGDGPRWRHPYAAEWAALLEDDGLVYLQETGNSEGTLLILSALDGQPLTREAMCCGRSASTASGTGLVSASVHGVNATRGLYAAREGLAPQCTNMVATWDDGASAQAATSAQPTRSRAVWLCPDGRFGVVTDGRARAGRLALERPPEPSEILLLPDGERLVVGTTEGAMLVVDLSDGSVLSRAEGGVGLVGGLSLSEDGTLVALRDEERGARLFDLTAGTFRGRLPTTGDRGARFIVGHPRRLVTWGADTLVTWDVPASPPALRPVADGVTALDIDLAHGRLAVATAVGFEVLTLADAARVLHIASDTVVKDVAFAADGERLAHVYAGNVSAFEVHAVPGGERLVRTPLEANFNRRVARVAAGRWLLAPVYGPLTIRAANGEVWWRDQVERESFDLGVAHDGNTAFLLGDPNHTVFRVDLGDAAERTTLIAIAADRRWQGLAAHPAGAAVACAAGAGVTVLDLMGVVLRELAADANARLDKIAWSADGTWIAAGGLDGSVYLWRWPAATAAPSAHLQAHRERVGALTFDPANRLLVSGGWDDRVRFIDLAVLATPAAPLLAAIEARWDLRWQTIVGDAR